MKPKRIILIRHGESEGNANRRIFGEVPDYKVNLTQKGIDQARQAGLEIKNIIGDEKVLVYVSPYYRTRQTFENIRESIEENVVSVLEDPRIREQDWGHLRDVEESRDIIKVRDDFGTFFYRIPDGESGADVFDRASTFLESLHRDFQSPDCPENVLIVTHGMMLRLFLMRWFHWSVEEFESYRNPKNCQIVVMLKGEGGRYTLVNELDRRGA